MSYCARNAPPRGSEGGAVESVQDIEELKEFCATPADERTGMQQFAVYEILMKYTNPSQHDVVLGLPQKEVDRTVCEVVKTLQSGMRSYNASKGRRRGAYEREEAEEEEEEDEEEPPCRLVVEEEEDYDVEDGGEEDAPTDRGRGRALPRGGARRWSEGEKIAALEDEEEALIEEVERGANRRGQSQRGAREGEWAIAPARGRSAPEPRTKVVRTSNGGVKVTSKVPPAQRRPSGVKLYEEEVDVTRGPSGTIVRSKKVTPHKVVAEIERYPTAAATAPGRSTHTGPTSARRTPTLRAQSSSGRQQMLATGRAIYD